MKKNIGLLGTCFILSFFTLLIFAETITPLVPNEGADSCVFKQMGLAILQGKTPYIDLFDHKGPFLYLINALGLWIGGRWGLFILNVLNLSLVLYFWNKIASQYVSGYKSFLPILFTLILYTRVIEGANLTEDWCLFPLSFSLYIASRTLKQGNVPSLMESIIIGISIGFCFFVRANNSALIVCSITFILYLLIANRIYQAIIRICSGILVGFIITTVLTLLFFYYHYGKIGVEQMLYGTFLFNIFEYGPKGWMTNYEFFFVNGPTYKLFYLFGIIFCGYSYINNYREKYNNAIALFFICSFTFCLFTMGRNSYPHYLITITPLYVMCMSYALGGSIKEYLLYCIVALFFSIQDYLLYASRLIGSAKKEYTVFYNKGDEFISSIEGKEKDKIWNFNTGFNGINILQRNNLVQSNRIILRGQILSEKLRQSEENRLESTRPKYIMLDPSSPFYSIDDSLFIIDNYQCRDSLSNNLIILEHKK